MKIALVGNQNSGKTTLFNTLTGMNQKIGNWPGVTIERKSGIIKGTKHELVDLPGIYSLSPYTAEEEVSRKFIFEEKPDLIINIIDATSIERSLYLTTQLMELKCATIIALNMTDILAKKGITIDIQHLQDELQMDIVTISALKKTGINELIECIKAHEQRPKIERKIYPHLTEEAISSVEKKVKNAYHKRFIAVKLLEGDPICEGYKFDGLQEIIDEQVQLNGMDMEQFFASKRYDYIERVKANFVKTDKKGISITDKLDKVFLNKWASIPIFAIIMFLVYYVSVGVVGQLTVDGIGRLVAQFGKWFGGVLSGWGASAWSVSLVCDGIVAGVGAVLGFVPQLAMLFLFISILETTGYMSRIAFLLDKLFKKFGLSGKSLIPFIVGSGCSVPAIMSARTVEDESERRMTIILTPFIPCSAKLPILALFTGFFFEKYAGILTFVFYIIAIVLILLSAIVIKKLFIKGEPSAFLSELPEYKLPSVKYVCRDVFDKTISFVKRAGSIILLCSVIIWLMLSFNWKFQYNTGIENSILASVGNAFAWVFYPMLGEWSWGATVSAMQGLVAKEQVVSSMAIIAGFGDSAVNGSVIFGANSVFSFFNGASAFAFIMFNLFSAPCFGAIAAMNKELGSTKRTLCALAFQVVLAWVLACICFGVGSLFVR